jgi:DNA-binding GntR family transcriptional regulator
MAKTDITNLSSIEKISLPDQIADKIRASIIDGSILPGSRLLETDFSRTLGVSRGALREALRTLREEGLVESIHNHGSYVARITESDLHEIYSLRRILEGYAIEVVARTARQEDIDLLKSLVDKTIQKAKEGDYQGVTLLDFQWHVTLWKLSNHQRLYQILKSMGSQIRLFLTINAKVMPDLVDSVSEHEPIISALVNRDESLASKLMQLHIDNAEKILIDFMKDHESESES